MMPFLIRHRKTNVRCRFASELKSVDPVDVHRIDTQIQFQEARDGNNLDGIDRPAQDRLF